ncbi:hypothetical protein [Embleya sp. NBC_00896]|uniref:hypothetical protein n=1 Tax=Embleya sp. NBC_00896 TaxID=2975961 RepID=UPI002F9199D9|nr:hypothetical protein OG928_48590 [Embleya sp. NBC_00896]
MTVPILLPENATLARLLGHVEDRLLNGLCQDPEPAEDDDQDEPLPAPFGDCAASDAFDRVLACIPARVLYPNVEDTGYRILGPDGRSEHEPVYAVPLDEADVAVLDAALRDLRAALDGTGDPDVREELAIAAAQWETTEAAMVDALARVLAVLTLRDADTATLAEVLPESPALTVVVLTHTQEGAYRRLAETWDRLIRTGRSLPSDPAPSD